MDPPGSGTYRLRPGQASPAHRHAGAAGSLRRLEAGARRGLLSCIWTRLLVVCPLLLVAQGVLGQERTGDVLKQLEMGAPAPPPEKVPKGPLIEERETPPEAAEEGEKVKVKHFKVEGATLIDKAAIEAITRRYEGRELTLGQITGVAREITRAYRRRGYLIAYAYIPAQEVREGVVTIRVVEGSLGRIEVLGNRHYSSRFIERHLQRVRKDPSLRADTLERMLLILNDYPSLKVRSFLRPGEKPGTTDLVVRARDARHLHGGIQIDDFGSSVTSQWRASPWFEAGNVLREGDLLRLRGLTGIDRVDLDRLGYGRVDYSAPVGHDGMRAGIYYTNSIFEAGGALSRLGLQGSAEVLGVSLDYPWIRRIASRLDVQAGFDYEDITDELLGTVRSRDRIRQVHLGLAYDMQHPVFGDNTLSVALHQGIPHLLGGAARRQSGASRNNADGGFTRLTLGLAHTQAVDGFGTLVLRANGQFSPSRLFAVEQFSIGGVGTVRGFAPTRFSGDSGYALNVELYLTPPLPDITLSGERYRLRDMFRFVLFADHGGVFRNDTLAGEAKDDFLTAVGAGLRLAAGRHFSVSLDWAVPKENGRLRAGGGRTYLQAALSF